MDVESEATFDFGDKDLQNEVASTFSARPQINNCIPAMTVQMQTDEFHVSSGSSISVSP